MTARVLVVDDITANVKLLEARLSAEYFEVLVAYSGAQALDVLASERVDVVLLDVMMPGMDGFEVCRRIKAAPATMHVPVIMVTALDQPSDKIQGLQAGADDFLTKPVDDIALMMRVKNLARLKTLTDEMIARVATGAQVGAASGSAADWRGVDGPGRVLLVEDQPRVALRITNALSGLHDVQVEADAQAALLHVGGAPFDLVIVSLNLAGADGLRLCSQMRALERTRHLPIIVLLHPGDEARLLRALDMGVSDYATRPIDRHELVARVRTQIRRKRYSDYLRDRLDESVEFAITDALTGLHNRRYLERHLATLAEEAQRAERPLAILVADIDNFKLINDTYGHDVGDGVLREFAARLRRNIRGIDLACRLGGEEFVIVMPDTALDGACQIGERLRAAIAADAFRAGAEAALCVTASIGIAALGRSDADLEALLKRADSALYGAKKAGRNRVAVDAA